MGGFGLILFLFVALICLVMVVQIARGGIRVQKDSQKAKGSGAYLNSVQSELKKLAIPSSKSQQLNNTITKIVMEEVRNQTFVVKQEMAKTYRSLITQSEQAIKKLEKKYETVQEDYVHLGKEKKKTEKVVRSMSEGRIVVNEKGEAVAVNDAAEKLLGLKRREIIGKPIRQSKSENAVISFVDDASQTGDNPEVSSQDEDAVRMVRERSAVIETEKGDTRGMLSALPHTMTQKEIEHYQMKFMANISHELRSPLYCVYKSLYVICEELMSASDEQKKYIGIAHRNIKRLEMMINQILDYSKLKSNHVAIHCEPVSMDMLFDDVMGSLGVWAKDKGIAVAREVDPSVSLIMGDRERLDEVLMNLVSNALKFTPNGGKIHLRATVCRSKPRAVASDGSFVQISVEDSGIGIKEKDLPVIFQQFRVGSQAPLEHHKGTGLGLSICKEIVERHGGCLWADSREGEGARFHFIVPQQIAGQN